LRISKIIFTILHLAFIGGELKIKGFGLLMENNTYLREVVPLFDRETRDRVYYGKTGCMLFIVIAIILYFVIFK
jgi:hypothetical protein